MIRKAKDPVQQDMHFIKQSEIEQDKKKTSKLKKKKKLSIRSEGRRALEFLEKEGGIEHRRGDSGIALQLGRDKVILNTIDPSKEVNFPSSIFNWLLCFWRGKKKEKGGSNPATIRLLIL